MANVNAMTSSSSSTSSLYGNRNVLSGLASGMDTEAMIENSVSGYQAKITELQQKQTKIQWKQDSVRSMLDQAVSINSKYTSYTSATNLMSASFFTNSRSTVVNGAHSGMISAAGKSSSEIQITKVSQLATATRYSVSSGSGSPDSPLAAFNGDFSVKLRDLGITDSSRSFSINGVTLDNITKDSSMEDLMSAINSSSAGVTASYSSLTNQITFTSKETGSGHDIQMDDGMAVLLFGDPRQADENTFARYDAGKKAQIVATVNGQTLNLERDSNTFDMDGLSVTLKGTFETRENELPVTFSNSANTDKIVDAVKSFVTDLNKLLVDLHSAYTTQPERKTGGGYYEPLTESDKNSMSESAIKSYEETAKKGVLFADSDVSSMYNRLVQAVSPGGDLRKAMESIGISTSYADYTTTVTLNEDKLRNVLEGGTEQVQKVFADSSYGASDGLMGRVKKVMDTYANTSSASPGILVRKAGSKSSSVSLLNNQLQKQIDNVQSEIERWQTKMSSKVDYYTRQFTKLEQLMNSMNSQSSMMAGLMGG